MKNLTTTITGNLFNLEGRLTHAGYYASEFSDEADKILESVSDRRAEIYDGDGWSDIMLNESTGQLFAVWANDSLTAQDGLLQYIELDEEDCPAAFKAAKEREEQLGIEEEAEDEDEE